MKRLKEVVDKQRDEIRAKDRELTLKNEDIEAVRPRHCFGNSPEILNLSFLQYFPISHISLFSQCGFCKGMFVAQ